MNLTKIEGSENYTCTIVKLPVKQKVEGLDNLVKVTIFGNDVLTKKDADEDTLYLFFPCESQISPLYLAFNDEFRATSSNKNPQAKPGFFEDNGRVKAVKFKGVVSTGYIAPVSTLSFWLENVDAKKLKEGDEFNEIDGVLICKKYKIQHIHSSTPNTESRFNKKLKRFFVSVIRVLPEGASVLYTRMAVFSKGSGCPSFKKIS